MAAVAEKALGERQNVEFHGGIGMLENECGDGGGGAMGRLVEGTNQQLPQSPWSLT